MTFALVKIFSFIFIKLSPEVSLFIGRIIGRAYFFLDRRHRRIAYRNLRLALSDKFSPEELRKILKNYYLNLAQNFIEVLYMPKIDSSYIDKYINIEGLNLVKEAAEKGKGAILTAAHFGNWEIYNIIAKYLCPREPYFVLARQQLKLQKLGQLLDSYREMHGYKVVSSNRGGIKEAIANLKKGALLGMVIDQGISKSSVFIDFFKHRVPAPTGAIKLRLEFGVPLILTYMRRIKGPYQEMKIFPALELKGDNSNNDQVRTSAQTLNDKVQGFISEFPDNYLWQFKRFKNRTDRTIIILNDCKPGHLRQSEAVAQILSSCLEKRRLKVRIEVINAEFKAKTSRVILGCFLKFLPFPWTLGYAKGALGKEPYKRLIGICPDFVISAGSSTACLNLILAQENQSKSIVVMKPSFLSLKNFDLVIAPRHDRIKSWPNVVTISGAANLISEEYLAKNSQAILRMSQIDHGSKRLKIGLLIGGDTKGFKLKPEVIERICEEILSVARKNNAQVLVSSSRRTSGEVEQVLKRKFYNNDLCKLLIIANENNIPEAVGGILGLCQIVVVSGESISMVSEAASSGKYVIVFNLEPKSGLERRVKKSRHQEFLNYLAENKYIYPVRKSSGSKFCNGVYLRDSRIDKLIDGLWQKQPKQKKLEDSQLIRETLEGLL